MLQYLFPGRFPVVSDVSCGPVSLQGFAKGSEREHEGVIGGILLTH